MWVNGTCSVLGQSGPTSGFPIRLSAPTLAAAMVRPLSLGELEAIGVEYLFKALRLLLCDGVQSGVQSRVLELLERPRRHTTLKG